MVVVAARREERRLGAVALGELETQDVPIEPERALEVGDLEVHVSDHDPLIDRFPCHGPQDNATPADLLALSLG